MKRKIRRQMRVALAMLLFISGILVLNRWMDHRQAQQSDLQARQAYLQELPENAEPEETTEVVTIVEEDVPQVQQPEFPEEAGSSVMPREPVIAEEPPVQEQEPLEEHALYLEHLDLNELRKTNPDMLGWISIPGTPLDYPVLQGEDNQYYLKRTWQGKSNSAGSIFLECKVDPTFEDFNTIIYGHNMKNGSMFGSLRQYRTQSHYEANPWIYIVDDAGIRRYEIFAAFEAEVTGYTYRLDINTLEKKQALLAYSLEKSVIDAKIIPDPEKPIITLSTCTGNGYDTRWVVQAVLTGQFPVQESVPEVPEAER